MPPATSDASPHDRFQGCLLGLAVGDAIGAPYEGLTGDDIYYRFGSSDKLVRNPEGDRLYYTDDTQMMIGVAETLRDCERIDEERLCQAFASNYQPERGYGRGARVIIEAIERGAEARREIAATIFSGGSLGNGAAMRVAPVGLLFAHDPDRVWAEARASAIPTHVHPVGIEGAQLMALAVALVSRMTTFDRDAFWNELSARACTEEFRAAIKIGSRMRRGHNLSVLGSTLHAHRSVITAMACFARAPSDFEAALGAAICLGDDTDTLAAMTGALVGAFAGIGVIPAARMAELENEGKGRTYIGGLADSLSDASNRLILANS